jgi:uncharacterized protein YqeY
MLQQVETDLVAAMRAGNTVERETLRMLKSALKNAQIEKGSELTEEEAIVIAQKEVKRRNEAIDGFNSAGKPELAEMEAQEAQILAKYVPAQMSENDIRQAVTDYLNTNPATVADLGKVMGALSPQFKGKADMGLVSKLVRETLSSTDK